MADQPAVLHFNGVEKRYGAIPALDQLSFALPGGGLTALLGRNGAGKTTAIRILLGLTRAEAGQVRLFGSAPGTMPARRRLGAMLQATALPDQLRVGELIAQFAACYPAPLALDRVLRLTGLETLATRRYGALSGGQKRLVQFAIALAGDPDLLLLDEPCTGLDVAVRTRVWAAIRTLVAQGKTLLLTTHDLAEAEALADRVLVIDRGRLLADGSAADIKAQAGGKRIRCRTALDDRSLKALPGVTGLSRQGAWTSLTSRSAEDSLRALLAKDPGLSDLTVAGAGLEDAFLHLTESRPDIERTAA